MLRFAPPIKPKRETKEKKRKHFYSTGIAGGSINDGLVRWVVCLCCAALALCRGYLAVFFFVFIRRLMKNEIQYQNIKCNADSPTSSSLKLFL
jgi:hypothetical protein